MGRNSVAEIAVAVSKLGLSIHSPDYKPVEQTPVISTPVPTSQPIVIPEKVNATEDMSEEENENKSIPLTELGLPQNAYFALLQRGVQTAGDIADLTPFAWKQMKQLKQSEVVAIQTKLKELGLRIKK